MKLNDHNTRQDYNFAIVGFLRGIFMDHPEIPVQFEMLAKQFPDQRAGQIITNYICDDYRSGNPSTKTTEILEKIFPGNPDPFFEESGTTYRRLLNMVKI